MCSSDLLSAVAGLGITVGMEISGVVGDRMPQACACPRHPSTPTPPAKPYPLPVGEGASLRAGEGSSGAAMWLGDDISSNSRLSPAQLLQCSTVLGEAAPDDSVFVQHRKAVPVGIDSVSAAAGNLDKNSGFDKQIHCP